MMEEVAKVIGYDDSGWLMVEVKVKSACNHCDNSDSCGTSAVAKAFSPKVQQFSIRSDSGYHSGDLIRLGLPESVILKAAALVYLLPLLGFFLGAILSVVVTSLFAIEVLSQDLLMIPSAFFGALLFWRFGRKSARKMESDSQPIILAKLGRSISS